MVFTEFPITGSLRFVLLVLDWIFVIFSCEIGIFFVVKYKKQPRELKNSQDLGFCSLFFGFSLMRFFFLITSFYFFDIIVSPFLIWAYGNLRWLNLNLGYFSIMLGILFFSYFMEEYKKFLFRKYFFTYCFAILLSFFLILFFFNLEIINSFSILSWPLFLVFFILYAKDLGKKLKNQEIIPHGFLKMILILIFILIGYIFSMDLIVQILGFTFRLIGIFLQLIAISLFFIFFRKLPPFFELDWQDKIESIFILNKNGICLYNHSFTDIAEVLDRQFISGTIASMNIMLNELINGPHNEILVLRKKGKITNIFLGNHITGVLISKEELNYFKYNLKKLVLKVEDIYKRVLVNWNGDLSVFNSIKNIINEIFSL